MAVARTMLAAVKEEASIISPEVASTARAEVVQVAHTVAMEAMNPVNVRSVATAAVKETVTIGGGYPKLWHSLTLVSLT